jgi:hypothetical protein
LLVSFGSLALLQRHQKYNAMAVTKRMIPRPVDDMRDVESVSL